MNVEDVRDPQLTCTLDAPRHLVDRLVGDLTRAKAADPLVPLTVVVARRLLARAVSNAIIETLGGIVNVEILTVNDFAKSLLAPTCAQRPMIDEFDERVILRMLLASDPVLSTGWLAPVAATPGAAGVLRNTLRDLRHEQLGAEAFASPIPGLHDAKREALHAALSGFDSTRLDALSADEVFVRADEARQTNRATYVIGVTAPHTAQLDFFGRCAREVPQHWYVPETHVAGHSGIDTTRRWLRDNDAAFSSAAAPRPAGAHNSALTRIQHGLFVSNPAGSTSELAGALDDSVRVVSAPDARGEVTAAARACLAWASQGIEFREMAIIFANPDPYLGLVRDVLERAHIPFHAYGGTPADDLGVMQAFEELLAVVRSNAAPRDVRIFYDHDRVPGETLERLGSEPSQHEIGAALRDGVRSLPATGPWARHLNSLAAFAGTWISEIGPVLSILDGLRRLDDFGFEVSAAEFMTAAHETLSRTTAEQVETGDAGRPLTRGVQVVAASSAGSCRFRAVAMVGLNERRFPASGRGDPLLGDADRRCIDSATGSRLGGALDPAIRDALVFAQVLDTATERLHLSYARAEPSSSSILRPSPFVRSALEAAAGLTLESGDITDAVEHLTTVDSPLAGKSGLERPEVALDTHEYRRMILSRDPAALADLCTIEPAIAAARASWLARRESDELTAYDGILPDGNGDSGRRERLMKRTLSATSLENYAKCPLMYFQRHVLDLEPEEHIDRIDRIDPLARGRLVHKVLEQFLAGRDSDPPRQTRRAAHLEMLFDVFDTVAAEYRERGLTGYEAVWDADAADIHRDLERWYDVEASERDESGIWIPHAFELRFGFDNNDSPDESPDADPLEIDVASGAALAFRGVIDRIDVDASRQRFRVIDYKTGRKLNLDENDVNGGRALQLPIYLLAAARHLGLDVTAGSAQYFYVSARGGFKRTCFNGAALGAAPGLLSDRLDALATGIFGGDFHPTPSKQTCRYCDFAPTCPSVLDHSWIMDAKAADPRVQAHEAATATVLAASTGQTLDTDIPAPRSTR